jgi:hypothetical protein
MVQNLPEIAGREMVRKFSQFFCGKEEPLAALPDGDADLGEIARLKPLLSELIRQCGKIANHHGCNLLIKELGRP